MSEKLHVNGEQLKEQFTGLAQAVADCLPEDWTQLRVGFFVARDGEESFLVYYSTDGGETYSDAVRELVDRWDLENMDSLFDAKELCQQLHALCVEAGDAWTQFTLAVNARGEFGADFDYDAFDSFDAYHIEMWKSEHLYGQEEENE